MTHPATVVLVGLRGAGKTSVGRALARELELPFVDLDEELAREAGASAAGPLLERWGEDEFRARESAALRAVLERPEPLVLATGGGVVERAPNREALSEIQRVVWLRASPEELDRRVEGDASPRPPLAAARGAASPSAALLERRGAWYRAVAGFELETEQGSPETLARRLAARWKESGGGK